MNSAPKLNSAYYPHRKRVTHDFSRPVLTDQSHKKMCDINNIMAQYQKTGLLPHVAKSIAKYQDNTLAIPLEQAYDIINDAKDLFYDLPADVRKLMDNDPTRLERFIQDPNNRSFLIEKGMLKASESQKVEATPVATPTPPKGTSTADQA